MNVRNARPPEQIALLSVLHFLNDIHISFLPTFVPELVRRLGLSLAEAGALNSLAGLITMFGQPIFGYWSDRTERPWYIIAGPVLACLGATLLPLSPNYGVALFLAGLWSIGSAVFHPQGSGGVGHLCGGKNLSSYIALFGLGGLLAAAASPLYAVTLVRVMGLQWMWTVAIVPVAAAISLALVMIPKLRDPGGVTLTTGVFRSFSDVFGRVWRVWLVSVFRSVSEQGIRFFLPVVVASRGGSLEKIGGVLFVIMLSAAISPLVFSRVAERFGRERTLARLLAAAPLLLVPAALTEGWLSVAFYTMGYGALTATEPITNAMAQEAAPHARAMASSIIMGFAFGLGGLFTAPLGAVADSFGLHVTMVILGIAPVFALPAVLSFPPQNRR